LRSCIDLSIAAFNGVSLVVSIFPARTPAISAAWYSLNSFFVSCFTSAGRSPCSIFSITAFCASFSSRSWAACTHISAPDMARGRSGRRADAAAEPEATGAEVTIEAVLLPVGVVFPLLLSQPRGSNSKKEVIQTAR
jgi:hypothetical protein